MPVESAYEVEAQEKWDHCLENGIRKATIGVAAGAVPALLASRSMIFRCGILGFSIGVGMGMAYREARFLFDKNVAFDDMYLVHLRAPTEAKKDGI